MDTRPAPIPSAVRPTTGPVPLSQVLNTMLEQLRPRASAVTAEDTMVFAGTRHESVPRALLLDTRLTPLERNAYQVFRLLLTADGVNPFPTYERLRPYLTSLPYSAQASEETVARALTLLRLTRWLSLAQHRRDPATGRVQGNLYVLHDDPLTPYEALQLDSRYLELASQALGHASKTIQHAGAQALKELTEDPLLSGRALPSRLALMVRRLANCGLTLPAPSSDSEVEETPTPDSLRNPKSDRTVRTVRTDLITKEVRTVPRAREEARLRLPQCFKRLKAEQQTGALARPTW